MATTFVKIYCVAALDAFVKRHPLVRLDAYIDDLTLSTSAGSEEVVEKRLREAALDLIRLIEDELHCQLAKEKTAIIASSDTLALRLASSLKCSGAVPSPSTASLGVDLTCGRKRSCHKTSGVRAARFSRGMQRRGKLRALRSAIGGARAGRIASTGSMMATEFGSAIN
jgi:hypothetical protein